MANLHSGKRPRRYGAPYLGRTRDDDCLNVALDIIRDMPRASTEKRAAELERKVSDEPGLRAAVYVYFMNRAESRAQYHSDAGHDEPIPPKGRPSPEERERATDEIIQCITRVAVLDLMCPNGKPVRENTGTYVEKLGGHLAVIGRAAGKKVVGEALTDAEAAKLIAK